MNLAALKVIRECSLKDARSNVDICIDEVKSLIEDKETFERLSPYHQGLLLEQLNLLKSLAFNISAQLTVLDVEL